MKTVTRSLSGLLKVSILDTEHQHDKYNILYITSNSVFISI